MCVFPKTVKVTSAKAKEAVKQLNSAYKKQIELVKEETTLRVQVLSVCLSVCPVCWSQMIWCVTVRHFSGYFFEYAASKPN